MAQRRAGKTVKVSVSLSTDDIAALRRHAKLVHAGNLSAAFADAAKWIRQREARRQLVETLGGSVLTPDAASAIDLELDSAPRRPRSRRRVA